MGKYLALFGAAGLAIQLALLVVGYAGQSLRAITVDWNSALSGCGITWLSGFLGAIPVSWKLARDPARTGLTMLASTMLRFVTTLGLVAALALLTPIHRTSLVVWVGAGYVITLAADTFLAIHWMRRAGAQIR